MRIFAQYPTVGRPEKLASVLESWTRAAILPNQLIVNVVTEPHDLASNIALDSLRLPPGVQIIRTINAGKTKISAFDSGVAKSFTCFGGKGADVVMLWADDYVHPCPGWDMVISRDMAQHFPALDGLLHYYDGFTGATVLCTHPVMGINMLRRLGHFQNPMYADFCCDDEITEAAKLLNKWRYIGQPVAFHDWHNPLPREVMSRKLTADRVILAERRSKKFGITPPVLTVMIPTLFSRADKFSALVQELYKQVFALPNHWDVEIICSRDQKDITIGQKRQKMLAAARGEYVCAIDDDDAVAPDYLSKILAAIKQSPGVDCVVFLGELTLDGVYGGPFDFDLKYEKYGQRGKVFERTPNHLCPVKREIATKFGFPSLQVGEDSHYAQCIRPHLKTQAVCVDESGNKAKLYHYRFSPANSETQCRGAPKPSAIKHLAAQ